MSIIRVISALTFQKKGTKIHILGLILAGILILTIDIKAAAADVKNHQSLDPLILEILDIKNVDFIVSDFDSKLKTIVNAINSYKNNPVIEENISCNSSLQNQISDLRAVSSRGLFDELYLLEGVLFESCKNYTSAKTSYEKSLKLRRNNPLALYRVAAILIREQHKSEATKLLQEAEWQGYKDRYILNFLFGVIYSLNNQLPEAINKYQEALNAKKDFLPAAKLLYQNKVELRNNTTDSKLIKKLDLEIPSDLGVVVKLDPTNQELTFAYIRYLLTSGNTLSSPSKLIEGEKLVDKWLKIEPNNYADFALLKVQFLEKQNRPDDVNEFLNELDRNNKLSPVLRIKRNQLLKDETK